MTFFESLKKKKRNQNGGKTETIILIAICDAHVDEHPFLDWVQTVSDEDVSTVGQSPSPPSPHTRTHVSVLETQQVEVSITHTAITICSTKLTRFAMRSISIVMRYFPGDDISMMSFYSTIYSYSDDDEKRQWNRRRRSIDRLIMCARVCVGVLSLTT